MLVQNVRRGEPSEDIEEVFVAVARRKYRFDPGQPSESCRFFEIERLSRERHSVLQRAVELPNEIAPVRTHFTLQVLERRGPGPEARKRRKGIIALSKRLEIRVPITGLSCHDDCAQTTNFQLIHLTLSHANYFLRLPRNMRGKSVRRKLDEYAEVALALLPQIIETFIFQEMNVPTRVQKEKPVETRLPVFRLAGRSLKTGKEFTDV